ncbi:hypothetical protein JJC00_07835 [Bradyrhizobium diazoefficiens]|uniref:hypothetical protein n=1 Tax=Bradyrhizobium diazoefficiens TaxID=1355477 RepID=UPI00190D50F0|nr:hypothetical protein [Bradyrhizobium diazoefficiens]QQO35530.1 hypothetical protein JJC00_07835 [Bradyrhizobium diazoefficiens]
MNRLLAQSVTALAAEGLIDLAMLAQDGVRVRASAGASSFGRRARLEQRIADVKAILAELAKEVGSDPVANEKRLRKRRTQRAAERLSRLEAAVAKVAEIEAQQPKRKPQPALPDDDSPDGKSSTSAQARHKEPACLDHRPRRTGGEDGRWRVSSGLQHADCERRRGADRGGG